ncbi:MAG TPA: hypothetical protein VMI31_19020 [Fimbriimonadaceae bacterium]|nr:hypothetical protein [Fimbriimonadaceae bacterium]
MKLALSSALAALLLASFASAGLSPESVAVVVNGDSQASLTVANAYAALRGIPPDHFIVLHHLSAIERTDIAHFRSEVLTPVLDAIRGRGLAGQIDCISYSVDIPYAVDVNGDIKGRALPQVITPSASANGLTYLSDWVQAGDINYLRLDINRYDRRILPLPTGAPLTADEQSNYAQAVALYTQKDYAGAIKGLTKLLQKPRNDPNIAYNLACSQALAGQADAANASLRKAIAAGWRNYGQTSSDPDLTSLHDTDDFKAILRLLQAAHIQVQDGIGFHRDTAWNLKGEPDTTGDHYMLSTMLGVTAGRGNSIDEILDCLRRAKEADFTAPKGTIYFERNGDVRSKTREWGFQPAADELERLGVHAVVEDGVLPQNRPDVAGAMIGTSDFSWASSHSTILPGAICEHLTSFGGMLGKGDGQTPCTEFIKNGASGSSGTVTEPYALQEKFPTPFIHVEYAKGFTLAESYYQSVMGPYQLLIIGDPLCRPWAKREEVRVSGLPQSGVLSGLLRVRPSLYPSVPVTSYRLYADGKQVATAKPGAALVLQAAGLGAGYHELSVVATCGDQPCSQYRRAFSVNVAGPAKNLDFGSAAASGETVSAHLSAKGAQGIELFRLGESVGRVSGDHGTLLLSRSALGEGTVVLFPVATFASKGKTVKVTGKPIPISAG